MTGTFLKDPELKIIQKFDSKNVPKIDISLVREFRLYLADCDIKNKVKRTTLEKRNQNNSNNSYQLWTNHVPKSYQWIESLLQTAHHHRKYAIDLVLAPFLTNINQYNSSSPVVN